MAPELINYRTKKYPKLSEVYSIKEHKGDRVSSPEAAYQIFNDAMKDLDTEREHFFCASVDTKNQLKSLDIISIGSINANIVHPREVFYAAIANRASAIIVAHNHPSGDPGPSQNDIDITRKLTETGRCIGIELYDHVIFGPERFLSLKEQNLM
jgi:DNA repair protein RadC